MHFIYISLSVTCCCSCNGCVLFEQVVCKNQSWCWQSY